MKELNYGMVRPAPALEIKACTFRHFQEVWQPSTAGALRLLEGRKGHGTDTLKGGHRTGLAFPKAPVEVANRCSASTPEVVAS
jgi:hypothetical protein